MASTGVIPHSTISSSSLKFVPCLKTPASVPMAILTPALYARVKLSLCISMTSSDFSTAVFDIPSSSANSSTGYRRQQRRYEVCPLILHHAAYFIIEEYAVLDGMDARFHTLPDTLQSLGVRHDFDAVPEFRLFYDDLQFFEGELGELRMIGRARYPACSVDLDDVRHPPSAFHASFCALPPHHRIYRAAYPGAAASGPSRRQSS